MNIFGEDPQSQVDGRDVLTEAGNQNIDLTLTTSQTVFSNSQDLVTKAYVDASSGVNPFNQDLNTTDSVVFSGITCTGDIKIANGTNSHPTYTFTNDIDTGMYSGGDSSNIIHFATGGVQRVSINNTGNLVFTNSVRGNEGGESAPAYSFFNNNTTGMYSSNLNNIDFATAGQQRLNVTNSGVRVVPSGIAGAPSYSFTIDPNTGMYLSGSEELSFSTSGQARMSLLSSGNIDVRNNRIINSSSTLFNTSFGTLALNSVTSAQHNVAVGYQALQNNQTRSNLVAIGSGALRSQTTGQGNLAIGYNALSAITTSDNMIGIGLEAGLNSTAFNCVFIGPSAGRLNNANSNVHVGSFCGDTNAGGERNVMIGYVCRMDAGSAFNYSVGVGSNCIIRASNEVVLGNETTTNVWRSGRDNAVSLGTLAKRFSVVYAGNGVIQTSDETQKVDIGVSVGLDTIMKLKPISYKMAPVPDKLDKDGVIIEQGYTPTRTHYGFSAQHIEGLIISGDMQDSGLFIKAGVDDSGMDMNMKDIKKNNIPVKKFNYGLRYEELIAPIVKSIQELNDKIKILESKI